MSHYVGGRKLSSFLGLPYSKYTTIIIIILFHCDSICSLTRSLHAGLMSESELEESGRKDSITEDSYCSGVLSSPSTSLCNQAKKGGDSSNDSDTDSDEDCQKHENAFTKGDLDITTSAANQDPAGLILELKSTTSDSSSSNISQTEDEIDGGGNKQGSSKQMISYRLVAVN